MRVAGRPRRVVGGALLLAVVLLLPSCADKIATGGGGVSTVQDVASLWGDALSSRPAPALLIDDRLTSQIGDWPPTDAGSDREQAETGGTLEWVPDAAVPDPGSRTIELGGARRSVQVQSAAAAVADMAAERTTRCSECPPIRLVDPLLVMLDKPTILGTTAVPVWSFRVVGSDVRFTRIAVNPAEYLTVPGLRVDLISGDKTAEVLSDRRVRVTFPGLAGPASIGACGGDYLATPIEQGPLIAIQIAAVPNTKKLDGLVACSGQTGPRTVDVDLSAPLGGRVLVDASTGSAIPRS